MIDYKKLYQQEEKENTQLTLKCAKLLAALEEIYIRYPYVIRECIDIEKLLKEAK